MLPAQSVASATGTQTRVALVTVEGARLDLNGQTEVPAALFGVDSSARLSEQIASHGVGSARQVFYVPSPVSGAFDGEGRTKNKAFEKLSLFIDCLGERSLPASVLTNPGYEDHFSRIGAEYAARCRRAGWKGCVEFWNEPFLDWADRGRRNYADALFDTERVAEGGPVTIKGWTKPLAHVRWRRLWAAYEVDRVKRGTGDRPDSVVRERRIAWGVRVPDGAKPGDTFEGRDSAPWGDGTRKVFTVVEEWHAYDPTQVRWWSGKQNLDFYTWMFLPFAKAVKESNPDITVIGGWGFNPSGADWSVWRELYVPLVDAAFPWMDGVNEHHYEIDTRHVPAWYEVATAYGVTRHGKWLRMYNTGSGGRWQPAVQGMAALTGVARETARESASQAAYTLRDLVEILCQCPDKAASRIVTDPEDQPGALEALRFLADFRGNMVSVNSVDRDVWATAAVTNDRLTVLVFNNASVDRMIDLKVALPGRLVHGKASVSWLEVDASGSVRVGSANIGVSGREALVHREASAQHALKFVFVFQNGPWPARPLAERRQFFAADGVLMRVLPESPLMLRVLVPPAALKRVERAWLRLATDRATSAANTTVNGRPLPPGLRPYVEQYPVEPSWLTGTNEVLFTCGTEDPSGFQINAASLVVEQTAR
jgi:hypothetical protein